MDLQQELSKMFEDSSLTVSLLLKELNHNRALYEYHPQLKLTSASMIKVMIMLAVLDEVCKGKASLKDRLIVREEDILSDSKVFEQGSVDMPLYDLISWMIISSDNTATNVLIEKFGMKLINDYIKHVLNLQDTALNRKMLDTQAAKKGYENTTSQNDLCRTFEHLFNGDILTKELCNIAIAILKNQRCQNHIMRYIAEPVEFAHKTGSLACLNHDGGVMELKGRLFYMGVSIYDSENLNASGQRIGSIGKILYDFVRGIVYE